MALCTNLYKSQYLLSRYCAAVPGSKFLKCLFHSHEDRSITLESDVLDDFTTQLMQKKLNKWEIMRARRKINGEQEQVKYHTKLEGNKANIKYIDINELDVLLRDAVEANNTSYIKEVLSKCVKSKRLPTLSVLLQLLSLCAHNGDKDTVLLIIELCDEVDPQLLKENSYFKHYLAEVTWIRGNINEAIEIFENVYRSNVYLRRRIRNTLKYLMVDAITNRSEAALLNLIRFAERLIEDYRDFYPLTCIWQTCFLSEWYTDQCIALDLLKHNEGLCKNVASQFPYVVALSLKNHQTEAVYRLLEVLLKFEHKSHYTQILEALFDYRVHQGDLRSCSEIIQWSLKQGVALSAIQEEKFVNLLLTYSSSSAPVIDTNAKLKIPSAPSYQFKF